MTYNSLNVPNIEPGRRGYRLENNAPLNYFTVPFYTVFGREENSYRRNPKSSPDDMVKVWIALIAHPQRDYAVWHSQGKVI